MLMLVLWMVGNFMTKNELVEEIQYLESIIQELEMQLQSIARDAKSFKIKKFEDEHGTMIRSTPNGNICSLCGTAKGVELRKGFDVYLCIACGEKWN